MIIAFTGMDGSGKSLQAKALSDSLHDEGFHSHYVWSRWSPLLLRPLIGLGRMLMGGRGGSEDEMYKTFQQGKRKMFQRPILAQIWKILACVDYSLQVLFKIGIRSKGRNIVVCDRYVHDLLVDLGTNFGYDSEQIAQLWSSRLLCLFPKPDLVFLLDLPPEVAFERKEDVPLSYLRDRRALYESMRKLQDVELVDATGSIEELGDILHRRTMELLDKGA
ncbi:dTMP kinase [Candidatus Zixiibacteriota bacterium]